MKISQRLALLAFVGTVSAFTINNGYVYDTWSIAVDEEVVENRMNEGTSWSPADGSGMSVTPSVDWR